MPACYSTVLYFLFLFLISAHLFHLFGVYFSTLMASKTMYMSACLLYYFLQLAADENLPILWANSSK